MSQQQTVLRVQSNIPGSLLPVYEFLDLYSDIPIKLNKSFAEIQDIGKKNTDYTIGLTIPGSKKNNRFFENFFNVDAQSLYFDATKRNNCDVLLGDEPLFRGYMRLNKVSVMNSKVQYEVTLYSTVSNLFGAIGNNLLRDLNFADSEYHFNHIFNLSNVTQNFNYTNFSLDSEKPYPYLYPIVHNGYNYVSGATVNQSGDTLTQTRIYTSTSPISGFTSTAAAWAAGVQQYQINSPTQGLIDNQLKPALNVWSLLKLMFKTYGYTIKSDFFNTPWMKSIYLYGYFSSEATKFSYKINTVQEFTPEGIELITIVSGGNANVYVCKLGTGIPCYSLSDINITVITEYPYEPIQYELPATIKAFTTGTTVSLGGDDYVETRTNSYATISDGPIKYLPQPVGTSIPYTDGLPVDFSEVIDINIKQIDLLGSIAKKFNLVFISNPDNPIEIEIEPYDFYIGTGTIYDWTDKISYDKGWSVEPALNFVESQLIITDLEDSDEGNKQFTQRNNRIYGANIVYNPTDFKSQEKKIETIFGPELIRKWDDVNTNNIGLPLGINYVANNQQNGATVEWQYTGVKTKPKLFFWLGGFNPFLDIVGESYSASNYPTYNVYVNSSDASVYFTSDKIPVISHTMPMGLSDKVKNSYNGNDSLCLLFNSEEVTDIEGTIKTYNTYTENDAYNTFYNNRVTNIYNPNTRFLSGYFNLKYNDVKLLKPKDIIKIQEQYFTWNKISDFNLTNRELTKVELVQFNVNPQEYPTRYFIYQYCDGSSSCYKIKTDFTNSNLRDTNFGWSVYYDHQVGSLSGQTSGFTSTFVDIQGGYPKYIPYTMYEITKEEYDISNCTESYCSDSLLKNITDNNGLFSSTNMPTFWTNSGTTRTGVNVFNNCDEFYSTASTYGILTGTSTYHGTISCPTTVCPNEFTLYAPNSSTLNGIVFKRLYNTVAYPDTTIGWIASGSDCVNIGVAVNGKSYPIYFGQKDSNYFTLSANANTYDWGIFRSVDNYCFNGGSTTQTYNTNPNRTTLVDGVTYPAEGNFSNTNPLSDLYNAYIVYSNPCPGKPTPPAYCFGGLGTGYDNEVYGLTELSDGNIVSVGKFTSYDGDTTYNHFISQLNSEGTQNYSYVTGTGFTKTSVGTQRGVYRVAKQSSGKVITLGYFNQFSGQTVGSIARINTDGSLDTTFNSGGLGFNNTFSFFQNSYGYFPVLYVDSSDNIYVGGEMYTYNGSTNYVLGLIKLLPNGTQDPSWTYPTSGIVPTSHWVTSLGKQSTGKIIVGLRSNYYGSQPGYIARLNTDGTTDSTFNSGGAGFSGGTTPAMAIQSDNKILVSNTSNSYNGTAFKRMLRLNSDGSIDGTFSIVGTGFNGNITVILVLPTGKIMVTGDFTSYNGTTTGGLVRLNSDGSLDTSWNVGGSGLNGWAESMILLLSDGNLLLGGPINDYNGVTSIDSFVKVNSTTGGIISC
jgi:uncharacterized delta-60 repeat protein